MLLILLGIGLWAVNRWTGSSTDSLLREAQAAYERKSYAASEQLALRVLEDSPNSVEARLIAARAAFRLNHPQAALNHYQSVPDDGTPPAVEALYQSGRLLMQMGQLKNAEHSLRRALHHDPEHTEANEKLIELYRLETRNWEARPHVARLFQQGRFNRLHLLLVSMDRVWVNQDEYAFLEYCHSTNRNDYLPLLEACRASLQKERPVNPKVREVLRRIVKAHPSLIEAQARLGESLLETPEPDEFLTWHGSLPPNADNHPQIWVVRAQWALNRSDKRGSARCFREAVLRDPNHRVANYQLAQLLNRLGSTEQSRPFLERARKLARLEDLIQFGDDHRQGKLSIRAMREIVELLESLGRFREAAGWCHEAEKIHAESPGWTAPVLSRINRFLVPESPLTVASANPARKITLSDYPFPDLGNIVANQPAETAREIRSAISFQDDAGASGLRFSYFNGADPNLGRTYMFEFSGGGVTVIDYDQDSWPDLYLTQGCPWPPQSDQTQYRNRLFRNLGNGRFLDVTEQAGVGDNQFGQGATTGDFDNDGFPDLYVANIGWNRFYRNNGDGTFTDITSQTETAGNEWTLSGLLADLNGDSLPDVYAVNYLGGPDVFQKGCEKEGKSTQCPVTYFPAEQDRLYLNMGDGRFQDVTNTSGIAIANGKGMGIVAADFDGSGRLSLFIANDTVPNFFFANRTDATGIPLLFTDRALESGLALGDTGTTQSCMGIAAGDINNDELLDLFVTNFYKDDNNMFVQIHPGLFDDQIHLTRLHESGYNKMGWGAQFLDADLDGFQDLVVANGHLDENAVQSAAARMPTQFFRNQDGVQFVEIPAGKLGEYFQRDYFGRSIARLDWNRDGREDFVVTHVDAPVALLTNQSERAGHFLTVQLRGVYSSRDAIGASVRLTAGEKHWKKQLIAGDGFAACNQRQLNFGIGEHKSIDSLTISWPSGLKQSFKNLTADREYLFIEGAEMDSRLK